MLAGGPQVQLAVSIDDIEEQRVMAGAKSQLPKRSSDRWQLPRGRCALLAMVLLVVASPALIVLFNLAYALASIPYCAIYLPHSKQHFMPSEPWYFSADIQKIADANATSWPVPKIIHQTWVNTSVPDKWRAGYDSCRQLHPDYQQMFWTDASARAFLAEHYPHALPNYDSYPFNIQRVDAIRYYLLYHYGGIYFDLDVGCRQRLDALRQYPLLLPTTDPVGFSNDVMIAAPRSPLMKAVIDALPAYNKNYGSRCAVLVLCAHAVPRVGSSFGMP